MMPCFIGAMANAISFVTTIIFVPETIKRDGSKKTAKKYSLLAGIKEIASDKLMVKLLCCYCINSFGNGGILVGLVLFFSLEIPYHGLGFTPFQNGIIFAWFGIFAFGFQIVGFKRMLQKMGVRKTYTSGTIYLMFLSLFLPCGGLFFWIGGVSQQMKILTWISLVLITPFLSVGFMTCLPVIGTMQSNTANQERQGLVQGTAQSLSALLRALGPIASGVLFSFSVSIKFPFLLFWFLFLMYGICFIISITFSQKEKDRIDKSSSDEIEMITASKIDDTKKEEKVALLKVEDNGTGNAEIHSETNDDGQIHQK